jgi:hypothetical protein
MTFTLTQAQVGAVITVTARYTDQQGTVENVTSAATTAVANVNDSPTGGVTISRASGATGSIRQGETLSASNTLADVDGIPTSGTGAIAYQWNANGTPIAGATASTFTLTQAQVGAVITVTARYTDLQGWAEGVTSAATTAVVDASGQIPQAPQPVSGVVQDGYIAGASIYLDRNGNGLADADEDTGMRTDADGNFSGTTLGKGSLVAVGGTNIDTGLRNTLVLSAPQESKIISPLTSLLQNLVSTSQLTLAQAGDQVATAFGLVGLNLLSFDPLSVGAGDPGVQVQRVNAQLALTASLTSAPNAVLQGIAGLVATTTGPLDLSSPSVLSQAIGSAALSTVTLDTIAQGNAQLRAGADIPEIARIQKAVTLAALSAESDLQAPGLVSFAPGTDSQAVPIGARLVFQLTEASQRGSGSIELRTADGTLVQRFEAGNPGITVEGGTLTIEPAEELSPSTGYLVIFSPNAFIDLAGNGYPGSNNFTFSTEQRPGDQSAPTPVRFGPANSTRSVALDDNLTLTFNELIQPGTGEIRLKTASGQVVQTFTPANTSIAGSTLTLNPSADLGLFTRYVIELDTDAVRDLAGNGVEALTREFRTASVDGLYHMFVAAFSAAPGAIYMEQLAEAYNHFNGSPLQSGGGTLQQIVEIFTTKEQFTSVYPESLSDRALAIKLVNSIVKTSATDFARVEAILDIEAALGIGWSRGKVLYTVFGNLATKPLSDPTWGATAQQFQNQLAVARYFTEVLAADTTDLTRLQGVLASITPTTDVSSTDKIVQIIGTVPPGG